MAVQFATPFHRGEKFGPTTVRWNLKDSPQRLFLQKPTLPSETGCSLILDGKTFYFPKKVGKQGAEHLVR
jgi:hypothetical protein